VTRANALPAEAYPFLALLENFMPDAL